MSQRYTCAAVSATAPGTVAFGCHDGGVLLVSPAGERRFERLHDAAVTGVAVSHSLGRLVTLASDGTLAVWGAVDGIVLRTHRWAQPDVAVETRYLSVTVAPDGTTSAVVPGATLSMSADGRRVFASGCGGRVVDVHTGGLVCSFSCDAVSALSPDGTLVAAIGAVSEHKVELITSDDGLPCGGWCEANFERVRYAIAWAPDGQSVAVSGYQSYDVGGGEYVWLARPGARQLATVTRGTAEYHHLCFSPDGAWLAWGTDDWVVGLTDVTGDGEGVRRDLPLVSMDERVVAMGFWSPTRLVVACASGAVWSWHLPDRNDRLRRPDRVVLRTPDAPYLEGPGQGSSI